MKSEGGISVLTKQPLPLDGQSLSVKPIDLSGGRKQYDLSQVVEHGTNPIQNTPEQNRIDTQAIIDESTKPKAIKIADQRLQEVNDNIASVSRDWNASQEALDQNISALTNLQNQLNDPSISEDVKQEISNVYNKTLQDGKGVEAIVNQNRDKAIGLQKSKSSLSKIYDVQNKLDMDVNDDALKATSNFLDHVYNAIPETVSGVGSFIRSVGDVSQGNNPGAKMLYDIVGDAIKDAGDKLKVETDGAYDDKHYISSTAGDIVGSVVVAAIPGSYAAKAGKVAQMISGATVSTMQMADGIHEKAKAVGLSDKDAGIMTLSVAPIAGLLEVWGATNIINNIAGKKSLNELIEYSVKNLADKEVTKELIYKTVGDGFKEIGKKYGLSALKSAGEEGVTEGLQGEVEALAENFYDVVGEKKYGTEIFSSKTQLDVAKQAAIGAVAGSFFGIISGVSTPKNLYQKVTEMKNDPSKLEEFDLRIRAEYLSGNISQEKAESIKANIVKIMDIDDKIPSTITNEDARVEAVGLISEKEQIQQDILGKEPALVVPLIERLAEINNDLGAIGREAVQMQRRDLTPTQDIVKPEEPVVESVNQEGSALPVDVDNVRNETLKDAIDPLPDNVRVDERVKKEGFKGTEEDFDNYIADNSGSAVEVAETFLRVIKSVVNEQDVKGALIDSYGVKLSEDKFRHIRGFGKKDLTPAERKYIDNNALPLDEQLDSINMKGDGDDFGAGALTEQDVIDHIQNIGKKASSPKSIELISKLKSKYAELENGSKLTSASAKKAIEQGSLENKKSYEKFVDRESKSQEDSKKAYEEGVKSGDLVVENGEVIASPENVSKTNAAESDKSTPTVVNDGKTPLVSTKDRVKALSSELSESDLVPKELRDKIKENGLKSQVYSHKEAKKVVDSIIEALTKSVGSVDGAIEEAVKLADENKIVGSVKAFVYGKAIDHYSDKIRSAETIEDREYYAEEGAKIAEKFESDSEGSGRFISAIGEYYKNHPDIIERRQLRKLEKAAEEAVSKKERDKIEAIKKEFDNLGEDIEKRIDERVKEELDKIKSKLPTERRKKADKAIKAIGNFRSKLREKSYSDVTGIVAAIDSSLVIMEKAIDKGVDVIDAIELCIARINEKLKGQKWDEEGFRKDITDEFIKEGFDINDTKESLDKNIKSFGKLLSEKIKTNDKSKTKIERLTELAKSLDEQTGTKEFSQLVDEYVDIKEDDKLKREQLAILGKYFPAKPLQKEKQKTDHAKIIEQYNAGLFEGTKNKAGVSFESLFYEKLGIVNPNSVEVKAKIKEFAQKLSKAPEGSVMYNDTSQEMMNYLADIAYQSKISSGASKIDAMWYANILSSPATHLRNAQFNIVQTMIAQPLLLMQKAALKGDFKAAATVYANVFSGLSKGATEAGRVMKTGKSSRFDVPTVQSITERNKYLKPFVLPGRALKASDILFTDVAYQTKLAEFARNMVKAEKPDWNNEQVSAKVNEMMFGTKQRLDDAKVKAEQELGDFYGPDWKNVKDINTIQKIREFQLMEQSMPEELQGKMEESKNWAKRSLLTNKPTGVYGKISDLIQGMNNAVWFTKFIVPFINVPLNVAQGIFERSPIGLAKAWRGKEGFGESATELTEDQQLELFLKAANYTVAMVALALLNGDDKDDPFVITGENTGNYTDNKGRTRGDDLEPYSVYIYGKKTLSYRTTPWAAVFLLPGLSRDFKVYSDKYSSDKSFMDNVGDGFMDVSMNYLLFINETSAMQGVAGVFATVSDMKTNTKPENAGSSLGKFGSGMIPYSSAIKYVNNTIKAATGKDDKRPIDWHEYVFRDMPLLENSMKTRSDAFGVPVKENFDIPLFPVGDRGLLGEISDKSKYYKLTAEHNYDPKYSNNRKFFVDGKEIEISKKELNDINVRRGELVREALDGKNVFISKDEEKEEWNTVIDFKPSKYRQMTTYDYMNKLDNETFKKRMVDLFEKAEHRARLEKYGKSLGVNKEDIKRFSNEIDLFDLGEPMDKIKSNNKAMEEYKNKKGVGTIRVDEY